MLKQEEMEKAYRREAQLKQEMEHQIQERMLENERLHREANAQQMEEYRIQMEHLHSNLVWMTAAAGGEDSGADEQPSIAGGGQQASTSTKEEHGQHTTSSGSTGSGHGERCRFLEPVLSDEEVEAHREAPWACMVESEAQWRMWQSMQIRDEEAYAYERRVSQQFWFSIGERQWVSQEGILPNYVPGYKALGIFATEGEWLTDDGYEEASRSLSRSSRKAVQRSMRKMVVAEAYSMPRVTKLVQEMGHESAGAYDINNGFDFTTKADRRRCFEELVRMDPDVLLVSPPCGPFSIIQELNYPKMGQRRAVLMLAEGVSHLEFAMKLFQWQVMRGRLAIFEHPATSKGWDEPCVERSAQMHGVERVRADQCAYGLRVKDELNKKPTDFLVNGKSLAKHLSKRCSSGQHVHEALMGGLALKAQHYPRALGKAMITGAEEDSAAWRQVWATEGEN